MSNTKTCVKITLTDIKPSIFESKIGGLRYIPHDKNFPTDSNGNQLRLLAQIECDKIQLDGFMKTVFLQFWILNDYHYGMKWDNKTNQNGFRVIYYPEIDKSVTQEEIENKFIKNPYDDDIYFPVYRECGMSFEKSENRYIDYDEIDGEDVSDELGTKMLGIKSVVIRTSHKVTHDHISKTEMIMTSCCFSLIPTV